MDASTARVGNTVDARRLYDLILQASNRFLYNCKHFSIEILRYENPAYSEIAERMKRVCGIIKVLADDWDPMMGQKAEEYCELMSGMGVAIENGDRLALKKLIRELERRSGL